MALSLRDQEASGASFVDQAYERLKRMAMTFEMKPGEKLNEGTLAKQFGLSRTPLREALNRLASEGFLRFSAGQGFFCRELDRDEIYQLYQLRKVIETGAIKLAIEHAKDADIDALEAFILQTGPDAGTRTTEELVQLDEIFHEGLMALSGNTEMLQVLRNVNARIQFVRWVDMDRAARPTTQADHRQILQALRRRDEAVCLSILEKHIDRRQEQITSAIKEGIAQIYMYPRSSGA